MLVVIEGIGTLNTVAGSGQSPVGLVWVIFEIRLYSGLRRDRCSVLFIKQFRNKALGELFSIRFRDTKLKLMKQILDRTVLPVFQREVPDAKNLFGRILTENMHAAGSGELKWRIAPTRRLMEKHPEMHFHFKPEIFIQMRGETTFRTPTGEMLVRPGEVAVMPTGVPHMETVRADNEPFRNLVIGFYSHTVSLHLAYEAQPGRPDIEAIQFYPTPNMRAMEAQVEVLVSSYHSMERYRKEVIRGLGQAFFAQLIHLVEAESDSGAGDATKIFQAKWIIREQLSNADLNVKSLAERLSCSADYLSHLFRTHTGETLIHYIQRQRTFAAMQALRTTQLSVAEVAWASGYDNPGYFIRIFKRFMGVTPGDFRKAEFENESSRRSLPKTVYFDRMEYSPGHAVRGAGREAAGNKTAKGRLSEAEE